MKSSEFKKIIKEAVKEAIQEELREIILEAVKAPKGTPIGVGGFGTVSSTITETTNVKPIREKYKSLVEGIENSNAPMFNMTSQDAQGYGGHVPYVPPRTANTAGEGSALPPGEVSLDQLMSLMNKR
jgi:hypothetical protein